jgi:hypothetical protein
MTRIWWFGTVWLEMSFFFPSLSSWIYVQAMPKIKPTLQLIFSFDSIPLLLFVFFLFILVASNWVLFFYFTPGHLIFEIYFQIWYSLFELLFVLF